MKNFRRGTLGEEADLKEFVNMLRKEFKEKFLKFKEENEDNIKVFSKNFNVF